MRLSPVSHVDNAGRAPLSLSAHVALCMQVCPYRYAGMYIIVIVHMYTIQNAFQPNPPSLPPSPILILLIILLISIPVHPSGLLPSQILPHHPSFAARSDFPVQNPGCETKTEPEPQARCLPCFPSVSRDSQQLLTY